MAVDIFIHDSLHTGRNVRFELDRVWPRLAVNGVALVDDVEQNAAFGSFAREHPEATALVCDAADGRSQFGRRVRVGTVAQHHIEQDHRGGRVGRLGGEAFQPQRLVDHRVRPADGELVVAEVDHHVAVRGRARAEVPFRAQRDVRADGAQALAGDDHCLGAERAARVQAAQRAGPGRDLGARPVRPRRGLLAGRGERGLGACARPRATHALPTRTAPAWTGPLRSRGGPRRPAGRAAWR